MILVFGEALVDLTEEDCGGRTGFVPRPGGSPYNVSVGLARLGVSTAFAGGVSSDSFGRMLTDQLRANGVDTAFLEPVASPSPLAFAFLDTVGRAEYAFHLEGSAALDAVALPDPLPDRIEAVHVGSLGLAMEPAATVSEHLLRRAGGERLTSMDPNVRERFVADPEAYRARLERCVARADVVKVSDEDLGWLFPGEDPLAAGARWADSGPALVVVTNGADGAAALAAGEIVEVPAAPVPLVDTIGAGDAFTSGMLCWLSDRRALSRRGLEALGREEVRDAVAFAQAVAGLTCGRAGADPPTRDVLREHGYVR